MFRFLVIYHSKLYWKTWFSLLQPFLFFCSVLLLYHLFIRDQQQLALFLPVLVMITLLLAHLLSLDSLFKVHLSAGVLDQVFLSRQHGYIVILAMTLAHWLHHGLCLTILALPWILSAMLELKQILLIVFIWLLYTANLTLVGMFTSGLTAAVKDNSLLLSLITLPFYLPNLIFSFAAYQAVGEGIYGSSSLWFLAALFCFYLALLPQVTYFALLNSNSNS